MEWLLEEFKPQELAFDPSSAGICNGIRLVSSELEIFLSFLYIRYCGRDCGADIHFPAPSSCQADAGGRIPYTPAKRCDSTRFLRISCCRKAHGTCKKGHHCRVLVHGSPLEQTRILKVDKSQPLPSPSRGFFISPIMNIRFMVTGCTRCARSPCRFENLSRGPISHPGSSH